MRIWEIKSDKNKNLQADQRQSACRLQRKDWTLLNGSLIDEIQRQVLQNLFRDFQTAEILQHQRGMGIPSVAYRALHLSRNFPERTERIGITAYLLRG